MGFDVDVDLSGQVALVTGGSRNIGLAIAEAFRSAGARVCIVARADSEQLEAALDRLDPSGVDAMSTLLDVADEGAVVELYERIADRFGPPSVLVNGAATRPHESFTELSLASWNAVIATVLTGAFHTSRELFRRLPCRGKAPSSMSEV